MKHSIRKQVLVAFLLIMAGTIMLCCFFNNTFLEKYYIHNKEQILLRSYESLNKASHDGSIRSNKFDDELWRVSGIYNISVIVIDADSQLIQSAGLDADKIVKTLLDRVFSPDEQNIRQIKEDDHYVLEFADNPETNMSYIQIWGTLDNGNLFMIRSVVESMHDSVIISNRFFAYVGLLMMLVSALVIWWITKKITDPIMSLTDISKHMAELNFEVRYNGVEENEIGVLGQHMNVLSEKLENTISELKTANNELQKDIENKDKLDEMRRDFLSNVSHELKTPLALIMGYAEGLKEDIHNDDAASREFYCDVIIDESDKMNEMVKKLLTLNQLEFGNDTISMERFDLSELIRNYIKSADVLIKQNEATVLFDYETSCYVWSDEFKIEEVITNYFSNALNHLSGDRIIEIRIETIQDIARITVFNTGDQIPEDAIPHLFEKFYKVDKARTREYGGNGVGLSIVKAIMDSVHQQYGVQNVENGVEFWFELPTK